MAVVPDRTDPSVNTNPNTVTSEKEKKKTKLLIFMGTIHWEVESGVDEGGVR